MDYEEKLVALEHLRDITAKYVAGGFASSEEAQTLRQELLETYGNVSDAFEAVVGKQRIEVPLSGSGGKVAYYPNFFEAGFMSGRTFHTSHGQSELFKVIGRVRELAKNSKINKPITKSKSVVATKFNVYISTFMSSFNLFGLTEEKLEKLVEAYHMGKDSVTLSGTKHIISNVNSIQIYTYNSNGIFNPEEYLSGKGLLTRAHGGSCFLPDALMKIGDNVTDNYIINDYGYLKKEEYKIDSGMESKIKIFVSHKESDKKLANALGAFLIDSLKIERE